jgi:exodeoxyribonuclease-3
MLRILSLNLNGIRSAAGKGVFDWLATRQADIVCVQELKAQLADLTPALSRPDGFTGCFHAAEKKGYSGVGIYYRRTPDRIVEGFGNAEFDAEGRYLQADFGKLSVVSLYLPSGSSSDERQQAKFRFLDQFRPRLEQLADEARRDGREVVLCGDWNIAHQPIDLKNWKSNQKNSGFLPEERAWLTSVFDDSGLGRRTSALAAGGNRRSLYVVVEPGPGLGQECRLAHRLPDRHARPGGNSARCFGVQGPALLRPCTADRRLRLCPGVTLQCSDKIGSLRVLLP